MSAAGPRRRVAVATRLSRALLGPVSGRLPRRYVRTLIESMAEPAIRRHVVEVVPTTPATVEHYDFPEALPEWFHRVKAFDEGHVYRLRDVCVSPHTGLAWLPDECVVLEESYGGLYRSLGWGDIRHEPLRPEERDHGDTPLVQFAPAIYFHWVTEILPAALIALELEPTARLLMPTRTPRYVTETAELLVGRERILRTDRVVRTDNYVMASIEPVSGFMQRALIDRVRNAFPSTPTGHGTIYISRRKDPSRALPGEAGVESALQQAGATIVYGQELSFAEQRDLFAGAEVIVGPHGGGLTNILWAQRAKPVVEIFQTDFFNDCYGRLSRSLGIEYRQLVATTGEAGTDVVDTGALLRLIDAPS